MPSAPSLIFHVSFGDSHENLRRERTGESQRSGHQRSELLVSLILKQEWGFRWLWERDWSILDVQGTFWLSTIFHASLLEELMFKLKPKGQVRTSPQEMEEDFRAKNTLQRQAHVETEGSSRVLFTQVLTWPCYHGLSSGILEMAHGFWDIQIWVWIFECLLSVMWPLAKVMHPLTTLVSSYVKRNHNDCLVVFDYEKLYAVSEMMWGT